jgi:hypothetical protein
MVVPLNLFRRNDVSSNGWLLATDPDLTAIIGTHDLTNTQLYLGSTTADQYVAGTVHDFPEKATLVAVHVYWRQDGSSPREMRMFVARCTHDMKAAKTSATEIQNRYSLRSGGNYIDYVHSAGNEFRVSEFTCNQNNTNFRRGADEIHLAFLSGDTGGTVYRVFAVMLYFSYAEASPFPDD